MKNNLKRIPNHRIVLKLNQPTNVSGRIYPDNVVNIDEDKDYLISFSAPQTTTMLLNNVCASAKLGKTKDCLYLKNVSFFRDNSNRLVLNKNSEKPQTIVDLIKAGAKATTAAVGSIGPDTKTVNSDFKLLGLFLTENKV